MGTGLVSKVYAYGCGSPVDGLQYVLEDQERNRAFWNRLVKSVQLTWRYGGARGTQWRLGFTIN